MAEATARVSAAYVGELIRRAVLAAAVEGDGGSTGTDGDGDGDIRAPRSRPVTSPRRSTPSPPPKSPSSATLLAD